MVKVNLEGGIEKFDSYCRERDRIREKYENMDMREFLRKIEKMSINELRFLIGSGIRGHKYKLACCVLYNKQYSPILESIYDGRRGKRRKSKRRKRGRERA